MIPRHTPLGRCPDSRSGFSLVEVTVALGIAAFCLLALLGLLPVGLNSNQSAVNQTGGATAAMRIMAELHATPTTATISPTLKLNIPAAGTSASAGPQTRYFTETGDVYGMDGSSLNVSGSAAIPLYRADVGFVPPANDPNTGLAKRQATTVRILVTWPAFSDTRNTSWAKTYQGAFEVSVALDRN